MAIICPTVTAYNEQEYRRQIERIAPFVTHTHIDLMDGVFAPTKSPGLESVWWTHTMQADLHIMYQKPMEQLPGIINLNPRLAIIHAEAEADFDQFSELVRGAGILAGLAVLAATPIEQVRQTITKFDHLLVFSGDLGHHGGQANLSLLKKIEDAKKINPSLEIAWDGGVNENNAKALADGGVDILNVGGFIQKAVDPAGAYATLNAIVNGK